MSGRLAGKTALITAAGQGIGYATAMAMANEGASVFATDVKPELLERFKGVAGVPTRKPDALDHAAHARPLDELLRVDVLFDRAGYAHQGPIPDCMQQHRDDVFNLDLGAVYMT